MTSPRRIRLLHFITSFQIGGSERQLVALGRGLDRGRFDLRVGCIRRAGDFSSTVEDLAIPISDYSFPSLWSVMALRKSLGFARELRRNRIEILHGWGFYPNMFAIPAARIAGVPVVVASIRDTGEWLTAAQRRAQRLVCRLADHVVVNARAVVDRLAAEGYDTSRVTVIENGVHLDRSSPPAPTGALRQELGLPAGAPLVALICRLNDSQAVELKGVRYFLEAAALVAREIGEARFLVVGGGSGREQMARLAGHLGLNERVVFTGYRLDIPRILSEITVAVSSSTAGEALSNSILEAMAAGRPVVATRVGGAPDAVDDGVTGILVPPRDAGALARATALLLLERETARRYGRAASERVARRFSLERMVRETEKLYMDLLESEESRARRRMRPHAARAGAIPAPREGALPEAE